MMAGSTDVLAEIETMSARQLQAEWERLYGLPAPALSPALLARGVAFKLQLAESGESEVSLTQMLRSKSAAQMKLGTQLIRQWKGRDLVVTVVEEGFLLDGEIFRSLSAIASSVTGTQWSGPRFFGLHDHG